mgnify:CR=1 FL=1
MMMSVAMKFTIHEGYWNWNITKKILKTHELDTSLAAEESRQRDAMDTAMLERSQCAEALEELQGEVWAAIGTVQQDLARISLEETTLRAELDEASESVAAWKRREAWGIDDPREEAEVQTQTGTTTRYSPTANTPVAPGTPLTALVRATPDSPMGRPQVGQLTGTPFMALCMPASAATATAAPTLSPACASVSPIAAQQASPITGSPGEAALLHFCTPTKPARRPPVPVPIPAPGSIGSTRGLGLGLGLSFSAGSSLPSRCYSYLPSTCSSDRSTVMPPWSGRADSGVGGAGGRNRGTMYSPSALAAYTLSSSLPRTPLRTAMKMRDHLVITPDSAESSERDYDRNTGVEGRPHDSDSDSDTGTPCTMLDILTAHTSSHARTPGLDAGDPGRNKENVRPTGRHECKGKGGGIATTRMSLKLRLADAACDFCGESETEDEGGDGGFSYSVSVLRFDSGSDCDCDTLGGARGGISRLVKEDCLSENCSTQDYLIMNLTTAGYTEQTGVNWTKAATGADTKVPFSVPEPSMATTETVAGPPAGTGTNVAELRALRCARSGLLDRLVESIAFREYAVESLGFLFACRTRLRELLLEVQREMEAIPESNPQEAVERPIVGVPKVPLVTLLQLARCTRGGGGPGDIDLNTIALPLPPPACSLSRLEYSMEDCPPTCQGIFANVLECAATLRDMKTARTLAGRELALLQSQRTAIQRRLRPLYARQEEYLYDTDDLLLSTCRGGEGENQQCVVSSARAPVPLYDVALE